MESRRNFYNNEDMNGLGGNSIIGPTMPDDYWSTVPDGSDQRSNDASQSSRRIFDGGKSTLVIEHTCVIDEEQLVVVGWLVSIDGDCMGKDFHLYTGENVIGRGKNAPGRVNLDDKHIHGEGELVLFYDPVNNQYSIRPKEGGNCLCYLNDTQSIQEGLLIKAYDCITLRERKIGNKVICKLIFVPLCSEQFTWDKGIAERNG